MVDMELKEAERPQASADRLDLERKIAAEMDKKIAQERLEMERKLATERLQMDRKLAAELLEIERKLAAEQNESI